MEKVLISDVTLRERENDESLSFKEKIDIVKKLDKLSVDIIETDEIKNPKVDVLFLHAVAPLIKNSIISCPVGYTEESVVKTFEAIKEAKRKRLHIMVPTSDVQMEYICNKKPPKVIEMIEALVGKATSLCTDVEFSALDATRAKEEFLFDAIKTAIKAGAKTVTVCDNAGEMLPNEFSAFIKKLCENVPELKDVTLSVECSDTLNMGAACIFSAVESGARQIKAAVSCNNMPSLLSEVHILNTRGSSIGVTTSVKYTEIEHTIDRIKLISKGSATIAANGVKTENDNIILTEEDDIKTVSAVAKKMGYDLSQEDITNVFEEFSKVVKKKKIGSKEFDAIIASAALQVAPTYKLKNYVINSGNTITASASMTLEKNGEELQGMSLGDGPIDAAFQCIEKISGRSFELDDFQIHSVTEGKGAVGTTVIKIRYDGKLYSGRGVSIDIVEASINAYINVLNKVCFEEV